MTAGDGGDHGEACGAIEGGGIDDCEDNDYLYCYCIFMFIKNNGMALGCCERPASDTDEDNFVKIRAKYVL